MDLEFIKQGERFVAEFEATSDFNLHIERNANGFLFVNQRTTTEGKYDSVKGASFNYGDLVIDVDFVGIIYPKYIQVVSKVNPEKATVTFNEE